MSNHFFQQTKSKLGKLRRWLFRTNRAYWFYKKLRKENTTLYLEYAKIVLDTWSLIKAKQWLIAHQVDYPWIYNKLEIDCAENNQHIYPLLLYQNEIIGYVKIALRRVYIEDYETDIALNEDEAFIYDTFILPPFRGKHLGRFLLSNVLTAVQERGISLIFCHVPPWNKASLMLYKKLGFEQIGYIRYIRMCGVRLFLKRGGHDNFKKFVTMLK